MQKYILNSGKMVEMNLATTEQALSLYRAIIQECKGAGLDITIKEDTTVQELLDRNMEAKLNVIGSEKVIDTIIECCDKVLYDKQRFSMELFENEKNKQDFFPLLTLVAVENLRPFFPNLDIIFTAIMSQYLRT